MTTTIDPFEPLVDKKEISKALSLSTRSIENLVKDGRIPFIKVTRRCIRFQLSKCIEALVESSPGIQQERRPGGSSEQMAIARAARKPRHSEPV